VMIVAWVVQSRHHRHEAMAHLAGDLSPHPDVH